MGRLGTHREQLHHWPLGLGGIQCMVLLRIHADW
jgi:hypothetical protein